MGAFDALDRNDVTLAQVLFKEVRDQIRARRQDVEQEEAQVEFQLGKIAEGQVRWHDAAEHSARAAQLDPTFDTLSKAEPLFREALRVLEASLGRVHPTTQTVRKNFANLLANSGG